MIGPDRRINLKLVPKTTQSLITTDESPAYITPHALKTNTTATQALTETTRATTSSTVKTSNNANRKFLRQPLKQHLEHQRVKKRLLPQ